MDVRSNRREAGGSSVVTANRLLDGRIVWLAADGLWSERIDAARVISNDAVEAAIAETAGRQQQDGVVGVYGVQINPEAATPVPVTVRERIRAFGPTVHPDFATPAGSAAHAS
ncbi:conserved hypothetical protein [Gluconacetobacter diazotrophicus PA1 5]|uniref:Uncharacterized protein n=2 Tax=Gluconacetobacter diazotrophicus TaxID=33996 RepID=A9H0W6_GLUDA|nr:DUF2849 domain-containing protein [Gluconacetobacter diazotrophicus]ACI52855.1 conserved hypothetical protein [Gluconacetobacter diazotrophicus PA1 5]MBB2155406.1 DUF2849 domain-containing protein [Gluconacetobacter diazotrophicus]TWB09000.1 uncharacterized protein DUF2849 [Gluconacetobacter diazotrophicus]CAP57181.1 conserved hypothetical protein [Gluconacetobacter diazotrophicus PA1 5]